MSSETVYVQRRNVNSTSGTQTQSQRQDEEEEVQKCRRSRCVLGMMVGLGLICVVLLLVITLQHISITAERDLLENTVEELKNTVSSVAFQISNFSSLSLEKLNLETRVKDLDVEKKQLQREKLELENRITSLRDELTEKNQQENLCVPVSVFITPEAKSWSESRQYCRDHGGDLVMIKSEEKQRHITSLAKEKMWIGLSDIESEGNMKWVDNLRLRHGFWSSGEPNDQYGWNEDCIELIPLDSTLNNWNDLHCSEKRKAICEK